MKFGSHEWYRQKYKEQQRIEAELRYRDKLKVFLGIRLEELKEAKHPLYAIIKKEFPDLDDMMTIDEARITKLLKKVFTESSMKALELTYKLDGSLTDIVNEPNYDLVERETKDIK